MRWVKADYYMQDRTIRLVASRRSLIDHGVSIDTIREAAEHGPELLEAAIRAMMNEARPELSGAVILYIGFSPSDMSWEAIVSHASLPPHDLHAEIRREPLWVDVESPIANRST